MSGFDSAPSSASTTSFPEFNSEVTGPKNRTGLPPWDRTVDVVWHAKARDDETRAQRLARQTHAFEAAAAHIWSLHRRRPPLPPRSCPSQPDADFDADADLAPATGWLALPAAARLQICADLIPDRFSPNIPVRLIRSHLARDVWLPGSLQELGPILAEVSFSAWARASFCLYADLLAAVLTLFPLYVVGSPFLSAQNSLATRWLPRYLPAVQSLVIELDLTRFGFGPSRGAQRLSTVCRQTEDNMEEWVGRILARPDGVDIERLVVLCRRFWGSRPAANKHDTPREYCSEQDIFPLVDVLGCLRNRVRALRLAGFPSSLAHRIIAGVFEVPARAPAVWARHSYRVAPSTAWPRLPGQCSMVDIGQGPIKGWGQLLLDLHEAVDDPAVCHPSAPGYVARRGPYILPPPAVRPGGETGLARLEVLGREAADRNPLQGRCRQSSGPSVKSKRSGVLANGIERVRSAADGDDDDDGGDDDDHHHRRRHDHGGGVDFPRREVLPTTPPEKEDHPAPADRRLIRRRKGVINGVGKPQGARPDSFTLPEKDIEPTTAQTPVGGVRRPLLGTRSSTSALMTEAEAPVARAVGGGRKSEEGGPAVPMLSRWPTFRSRPKTAAEPPPAAGADKEPSAPPQPQSQAGLPSTVPPCPLADHPPRSLLHKISIPGLRHKASAPVLRSKASSPTLGLPRRSVEPLPGSKTQLQHQQIKLLKPESSFSRLRKKLSSTTLRTKASDPSFPPPPPPPQPLPARAVSSPLATNRSSGGGPDRCGGDDGEGVADGRDPSGGQKMAGKQSSQNELRKKRSGLLLRGKESLAALRKKGSLVSMRAGQFGG